MSSSSQSSILNIGLLVVFILLIYFMMIRPQRKKDKEDREMRASLQVGDEIMTIGGVIGKVVKITDNSVFITTGADKTKIEFIKTAIASVNKGAGGSAGTAKETKTEKAEEKKPNRDKKVTPKKLGKKSEEAKEAVSDAAEEAVSDVKEAVAEVTDQE